MLSIYGKNQLINIKVSININIHTSISINSWRDQLAKYNISIIEQLLLLLLEFKEIDELLTNLKKSNQ